MIDALWRCRGFIIGSVKRDFKVRYQTSLLGGVWAVLNPLALVSIYVIVFSRLMSIRLPEATIEFAYGLHLCAGILCWNTFTEIATRCQNTFVENAGMIRKLSFPRLSLPVIAVLSSLVNYLIFLLVVLIFAIVSGASIGVSIISIVVLLLIQLALASGLGIILGVLNVFYRDVGQFTGIAFQFWFWLTPIVYPIDILPENIRKIVEMNPVTALVTGYQSILTLGKWPQWGALLPTGILSLALVLLGFWLFRKCAADLVDEL